MEKKFSVKYCVLLPLVLLITIFLLAVPSSFFGIEGLTVLQQRTIALSCSLLSCGSSRSFQAGQRL